MKQLLIVGGDNLDPIIKRLKSEGIQEVQHIDGRKVRAVEKSIQRDMDAILVITDFINHNLVHSIKKQAKEKSIPTFFSKRSWGSIKQVLSAQA